MLLQLKTSELGGGEIRPPLQVQRVFKSPGKIGLIDSIKTPQLTELPLIAINLLKFHKEANWLIKAYKDRSHLILKSLNNKKAVHIHSECNPAHTVGVHARQNT